MCTGDPTDINSASSPIGRVSDSRLQLIGELLPNRVAKPCAVMSKLVISLESEFEESIRRKPGLRIATSDLALPQQCSS